MITPWLDLVGGWFVATVRISSQAAVIALLILAAQFVLRKHLSPRWRHALWFLVIVRLLLPTLPESPLSLQRFFRLPLLQNQARIAPVPVDKQDSNPAPPAAVNTPLPLPAGVRPENSKIAVTHFLGGIWLAGALAMLAGIAVLHGRFRWSLRSARRCKNGSPLTLLLAACAETMRIRRTPRLLKTSRISTPAICGIFRPTLLLPENFETAFAPDEQRMVFLHELAHVRRGDLLLNPLLAALQIVHWFNPVLWIAFNRMRFDRECATDSLVLSGDRVRFKALYGETLLKLVEGISHSPAQPALLGILENKTHLQERCRDIRSAAPGAYGFSAVGLILICGLGIATLTQSSLTASDSSEAAPALPAKASKDEVRSYAAAVLKGASAFANSSLKDPQIAALKKVGPENIDILIEENAKHTSFGVTNPTTNYYLSMAVCDLARPQDREMVLRALPQNRYLVYTVLKMNWAKDAREELLRVFRAEPGQFAPGWIEAIASLRDPSTYAELKNYLIDGGHREHTYKALKQIPDIGDLKETVEKAWPLAKNKGGYEARDMAKIAAEYGLPDAAAYLQTHSDPSPESVKEAAPARQSDPTQAAMAGGKLSADEAERLTKEVAANPENLEMRIKLLGYYFLKRSMEATAREAAQPHILWIINHSPASPAAGLAYAQIHKNLDPAHYAEARAAWMTQVAANPGNTAILGNAAAFLQPGDPIEAEKLLRQAHSLEPSDFQWSERLAVFFTLQSQNGPNPLFPDAQKEALLAYEDALKGQDGEKLFYLLTALPKAALDAGEQAKARAYAGRLLELAPSFRRNWNYGNAVYSGNSVLGLIALQKGDRAAAETCLLAAGGTPGSPQLNSFGPDFSLAQQLLDAGQRETVIAFLEKVALFWKGHEATIREWQASIRKGEAPKMSRFGG